MFTLSYAPPDVADVQFVGLPEERRAAMRSPRSGRYRLIASMSSS